MATIISTPITNNERNPSYLPPRFEIRQLQPEHSEWAKSIVMHSNMYHNSVWPVLYPNDQTAKCYEGMETGTYLVNHQIASGMSFGVFDTEYQFKNPASSATGGKLYWDPTDTSASGAKLLEQMDFPLVSVALAYDQTNALDTTELMKLVGTLPEFGLFYHILEQMDQRDPDSWRAQAPREVLMRNATSTRHDYEGHGLMKRLAQFLMREARFEGYRGVQIECLADAVTKTWADPPEPFRGEVVASFTLGEFEMKDEASGEMVRPFAGIGQVGTKVYTHL